MTSSKTAAAESCSARDVQDTTCNKHGISLHARACAALESQACGSHLQDGLHPHVCKGAPACSMLDACNHTCMLMGQLSWSAPPPCAAPSTAAPVPTCWSIYTSARLPQSLPARHLTRRGTSRSRLATLRRMAPTMAPRTSWQTSGRASSGTWTAPQFCSGCLAGQACSVPSQQQELAATSGNRHAEQVCRWS